MLSLRVARALEELTFELSAYVVPSFWKAFACSPFWSLAPWPKMLRMIKLSTSAVAALESTRASEAIARQLPAIQVRP